MPRDTIALRTTYEVPLIWLDRAHGRERLAAVPAEATFRLRQVGPGELPRVGSASEDDLYDIPFDAPPPREPPDAIRFEGRSWRPVHFSPSPGSPLDRVREMMWNDGLASCAWLGVDLPTKLTTRPALDAFRDAGLPARILDDTVERLDAEAMERARLAVERDLLWDGSTLHYVDAHSLGRPDAITGLPDQALDCLGKGAIRLLEHVSDLAARDPEVGRLAAEARRVAIRGLVHAIPADGIEPALRKVVRLAEVASHRARGRGARGAAALLAENIRSGILPALEAPPSREDEASLSGLAP